jgi:hypothetical protein
MSRSAVQDAREMGRPPADNPKTAILNFRVHSEVRETVEQFARDEHRTVASMADLLIREALIARLKAARKPTKELESLP